MRNESIKVANGSIEYLRDRVADFRKCSLKFPEGNTVKSIYSDLADIFEGCPNGYRIYKGLYHHKFMHEPISVIIEISIY